MTLVPVCDVHLLLLSNCFLFLYVDVIVAKQKAYEEKDAARAEALKAASSSEADLDDKIEAPLVTSSSSGGWGTTITPVDTWSGIIPTPTTGW
jgi:hypothetical protein